MSVYKSYLNNEKKLISDLRKNKDMAFKFVLNQYHQKLFTYAFSLTRSYSESDDLVQSVFLKIWEKRQYLKPDMSLTNLMYKMLYNMFLNQYKKKNTLKKVEELYMKNVKEVYENLEQEDKHLEAKKQWVENQIQNLPPKCKQIFILSKQEGLSNKEIATYLDLSIRTVEAQIHKAFTIIRKSLKERTKHLLFLLFKQNIFFNK